MEMVGRTTCVAFWGGGLIAMLCDWLSRSVGVSNGVCVDRWSACVHMHVCVCGGGGLRWRGGLFSADMTVMWGGRWVDHPPPPS